MSRNPVRVSGLKEFRELSQLVAPRELDAISRTAVHQVAGAVRKRLRERVKAQAFDSGTLFRAIATKRRRGRPGFRMSDVEIQHGAGAKHDAWYWHFIEREYGGVRRPATPFIRPTVTEFEPQIPKLLGDAMWRVFHTRMRNQARRRGVRV